MMPALQEIDKPGLKKHTGVYGTAREIIGITQERAVKETDCKLRDCLCLTGE